MANFEEDLRKAFKPKMQANKDFCIDVWSALANVIWVNKDGTEFSCNFRYAGSLIVDILGRGDYMDWYCSGPYGLVSVDIAFGMQAFGWTYIIEE
jgi:hypothetical protein